MHAPLSTFFPYTTLFRSADLGLTWTSVDWFSAYRVHHRIASHFRMGPTFLAGDAAHVHSPLGGQGMNTGLQDSHHLANLLADVARGRLAPAALERYERERLPVARKLIAVTDRAFGLIARPGRGVALLRRGFSGAFAGLVPTVLSSPLGRRLGGLLGQYRIRYRAVPKRSEEHTSELQSRGHLVCRLPL